MRSTLGDRVREARTNRDLDQASLADKIGVATRTVQRWEKGDQVPDGTAILKIARATTVQASWLLTGEGEMYPPPVRPQNVYPLTSALRRKVHLVDLPVVSAVPAGKVSTMFRLSASVTPPEASGDPPRAGTGDSTTVVPIA